MWVIVGESLESSCFKLNQVVALVLVLIYTGIQSRVSTSSEELVCPVSLCPYFSFQLSVFHVRACVCINHSVNLFLDRPQAQVLYDFSAEPGNNELTVKEGETVTITNQVNNTVMTLINSYT